MIFTDSSYCQKISSSAIMKGALRYALDVINNADIYSRPRIISVKTLPTSSSIFRDSKPDAIMNIGTLYPQNIDSVRFTYIY